jgi:hypothetical protein
VRREQEPVASECAENKGPSLGRAKNLNKSRFLGFIVAARCLDEPSRAWTRGGDVGDGDTGCIGENSGLPVNAKQLASRRLVNDGPGRALRR